MTPGRSSSHAPKVLATDTTSVNKMIALADAILNKGKTPAKTVAEVAEAGIDMVEAALGSLTEESSTSESSKGWRDGSAWGEIPYTDADVADELSLMGTLP